MISQTCSPRWATPRTGRPTDGPGVARVAQLLGAPLIPWQAQVAAVAGERLPDGALAYQRVVLVVPRRAGKSTLMLATALERGRTARRRRAFYAAHRRETAADLWREDWFPAIEDSPLARFLKMRRANGSESITWAPSGSTFKLMPADGDAMRSFRSELAMIDEAREFSADQGAAVEAGVFPTQATGLGGQTWIVSNAGGPHSTWLAQWRDRGRAAVESGATTGVAFFEWSADPAADPNDRAVWWGAHPGLGHHVRPEALEADFETMAVDAFACEYLGIWSTALVDTALVDAWASTVDPDATVADPVAFGVETAVDRSRSVIVAAGGGPTPTLELVEDRPHGPWLVPRLRELTERHQARAVAWDAAGPANADAADIAAEVFGQAVGLGARQMTAAAGGLYDAVRAGRVVHRDDPALAAAVAAARWRTSGGSRLFDRRDPVALPLIAASLARWCQTDLSRRAPTIH